MWRKAICGKAVKQVLLYTKIKIYIITIISSQSQGGHIEPLAVLHRRAPPDIALVSDAVIFVMSSFIVAIFLICVVLSENESCYVSSHG